MNMMDGAGVDVWMHDMTWDAVYLAAGLLRGWFIMLAIFGMIAIGKVMGAKNQ